MMMIGRMGRGEGTRGREWHLVQKHIRSTTNSGLTGGWLLGELVMDGTGFDEHVGLLSISVGCGMVHIERQRHATNSC